jgi:hypothetical protein
MCVSDFSLRKGEVDREEGGVDREDVEDLRGR